MSKYELAIENARIVLPGEKEFNGSIGVSDGRVVMLSKSSTPGSADKSIDANGLTAIPGVVDGHAHYGLGSPLDVTTETRAAARAGITTAISYLLKPDGDMSLEFRAMMDDANANSYIDFGLHFGVSSEAQIAELQRCADDYGVTSHKFFTSFKRPSEGTYVGVNSAHEGILYAAMQAASADERILLVVHAETIEIVWTLASQLEAQGADGLRAWDASRPSFTESDAISSVALFGSKTGARLYIPHVSSADGIAEVARWGSKRPLVETCPHYLTHTRDEVFEASIGKVNPPLRGPEDVHALWSGIFDGIVDVIGSDHNSRTKDRKLANIWKASAGFPSQGTMLPAVLTEGVLNRGLSLGRAVELLSSAPAQVFGRYPQKGTLLPGSDADLVLVDMENRQVVDTEQWGSSSDYSLDSKVALSGWPVMTILRGSEIWNARDGWVSEPIGQYVRGGAPSYRITGVVGPR